MNFLWKNQLIKSCNQIWSNNRSRRKSLSPFLTYIVSEALMIKWWYGLLILAINIGIIIYAGAVYRKALGGYIDYKDASLPHS